MQPVTVPFFRPDLGEGEIDEVVATLRSGWLTTGPKVHAFESAFRSSVHAQHAVAVNSCTAALHLALDALDVKPGDAVLVPTMTFAATAEVVQYMGATPVLVDCEPDTLNLDLEDAERKLAQLEAGAWARRIEGQPVGIIPVHVGGHMMNISRIREFSSRHGLWVVEDAAHAYPAAWRATPDDVWQWCGEHTGTVSCFSFYANKTITTGEGGMAVTGSLELADRMRVMSLHGLSTDAWGRYTGHGTWDYRIVAPGYKYNLTDLAASIGLHQIERAEQMRRAREAVAMRYFDALGDLDVIELPALDINRLLAWHLFPIKLRSHMMTIDRREFIDRLRELGVLTSVHWRPLHLHPYYRGTFGWTPEDLPVASEVWQQLVSLPIFSAMRDEEVDAVIAAVRQVCAAPRPATPMSAHPTAF